MKIKILFKESEIEIITPSILDNNFTPEEIAEVISKRLTSLFKQKIDKTILNSKTIKELLWKKQ